MDSASIIAEQITQINQKISNISSYSLSISNKIARLLLIGFIGLIIYLQEKYPNCGIANKLLVILLIILIIFLCITFVNTGSLVSAILNGTFQGGVLVYTVSSFYLNDTNGFGTFISDIISYFTLCSSPSY
jgi:hypothetical protein